MSDEIPVEKYGFVVPVPLELLEDSRVDLTAIIRDRLTETPEQAADRELRNAAYRARRDAATADFWAALDAITDEPARTILDLHQRRRDSWGDWVCHGCDAEGYEAEYPHWPCGTTSVIADHYGIEESQ